MRLKILAIVALAVVGVGAAFVAVGGLPASAASTPDYLTSAATTGNVTDDVAATGALATTTSYGLSFGSAPHLAGASSGATGSTTWTASKVDVKVGDTVKKGAVLAVASTTDLKRQLADATSAWESAGINRTIARQNLADASGTDAIRQATIALNNAETQVSDTRKARQDLAAQISRATITAPIDGIVTAVNVVSGLDAPSGDAIVLDSTTFQVTADVVESDLAKIAVGQTASVAVTAVGTTVTGTVSAISPTASTATGTNGVVSYPVTVTLNDVPAGARAGMTADITITIASADSVLTVPATALRGTAGNYTVLVMDAAGQPVTQAVQVGLVTASTAEIKSGLTAGQVVVTGVKTTQTTVANGGGGFGGTTVGIPGGGQGRPRTGTGN
jgi:macrolide-specific efflux system membrane fusion protein